MRSLATSIPSVLSIAAFASIAAAPTCAVAHGLHTPWLDDQNLESGLYVVVDAPSRVRSSTSPIRVTLSARNIASSSDYTVVKTRWIGGTGTLLNELNHLQSLPSQKALYQQFKAATEHTQGQLSEPSERSVSSSTALRLAFTISEEVFVEHFSIDPSSPLFWGENENVITASVEIELRGSSDSTVVLMRSITIRLEPPLPTGPVDGNQLGPQWNVQEPGWYAGDQHLHSEYSFDAYWFHADSGTVTDFAYAARNNVGLDWIIITDHSNVEFLWGLGWYNPSQFEAGREAAQATTELPWFLALYGEEMGVHQGGIDPVPAHYLAYPYSKDSTGFLENPVLGPGDLLGDVPLNFWAIDSAETIIERAGGSGGMGFIAHPFKSPSLWGGRPVWRDWNRWDALGWAGFEIWSGDDGEFGSTDGQALSHWYALLRGIDLVGGELPNRKPAWPNSFPVGIGNSDAHDISRIGKTFTYSWMDTLSRPNVTNALMSGHCVASNGPLGYVTINGKRPGEVATVVDGQNLVYVHVHTTSEFNGSGGTGVTNFDVTILIHDSSGYRERDVQLDGFSGSTYTVITPEWIQFNEGSDKFVTAHLHSEDGTWRAYSNPIWLSFETPAEPTAILLTGTVAPNTNVPPYSIVHVSGEARYNVDLDGDGSNDPVEVGTVLIDNSENVYTAVIRDGFYERDIPAPGQSATITITATENQYGLPAATITRSISVQGTGGTPDYDLEVYTVYDVDYDGDGNISQWWYKDVFRTTDEYVGILPYFTDVYINEDIPLESRVYKPNGTQYGSSGFSVLEDPHKYNYEWWNWYVPSWTSWYIHDHLMAYVPGQYRAEFYVDGNRKWRQYFTVAWDFTEHRMCKNVQASEPYGYVDATNVFAQNDEKAVTWANFDNVAQATELKCDFIEPNGNLYDTVDKNTPPGEYRIVDPADAGYEWWDYYRAWASIGIAGSSAANKCGDWTAKVYVKNPSTGAWDDPYYEDYFQILEEPPSFPFISVSAGPDPSYEGQSISLNVSASDNTYLKKVILHWNDGDEHSQLLNDSIFASTFSDSHEIGSTFAEGQEIEYWAEVWDSSGNRTESSHRTVIVGPGMPEIDLGSIENGGTWDWGIWNPGYVQSDWLVKNIGPAELHLTGNPKIQISGTDASDVSIVRQPDSPIATGQYSLFSTRVMLYEAGPQSAMLSIPNNDPDENPFRFTILWDVRAIAEIGMKGKGMWIDDGDTTPSLSDGTDFGAIPLGDSLTSTFTVLSQLTGPLELTGSPRVRITGPNASDFTVTQEPENSIAPGETTVYQVQFTPSQLGLHQAVVEIENNDANRSPFDFAIQGTALPNIITVSVDIDHDWMYQSLPGQSNSMITAIANIGQDPLGNSSYNYDWLVVSPADATAPPDLDPNDQACTVSAGDVGSPGSVSDSGGSFVLRVTVTGNDHGNIGMAETPFGVCLLGDVDNDTRVDANDRSIVNAFWKTGAAGSYALYDCDVDGDGVVDANDRSIVNAVWKGTLGQNSVGAPCPNR